MEIEEVIKIIDKKYNKLENPNARVYVLEFIKQLKTQLNKKNR